MVATMVIWAVVSPCLTFFVSNILTYFASNILTVQIHLIICGVFSQITMV